MVNIVAWLVSSVIYVILYGIWFMTHNDPSDEKSRQLVRHWGIIILLALPININGTVVTVMGAVADSHNSYAIVSPYQVADNNANALISFSLLQKAGHDATTVIGIVIHQEGKNDATTWV